MSLSLETTHSKKMYNGRNEFSILFRTTRIYASFTPRNNNNNNK